MDRDRQLGGGEDADQGGDLVLVGVHPARRDQPDHMRRAAPLLDPDDELLQRRGAGERAVGDRRVDAHQVLHDDAAGADIGVPDLGIAHLPVGQADEPLARLQSRVRPARGQRVPYGGLCRGDGIVVAVRALAPAVEDAQHERTRAWRHGR